MTSIARTSAAHNLPITKEFTNEIRNLVAGIFPEWTGPLNGNFSFPNNQYGTAVEGVAQLYRGEVRGDEWALASFYNPPTGTMHMPGIYHKVENKWTAVDTDPAPGSFQVYGIPVELQKLWKMPKDEFGNLSAPDDAINTTYK